MANWRDLINKACDRDVITHCTLSDDELLKEFYDGFGWSQGKSFTAWSNDYVYFPVVYDGSEWVGRAPRNPSEEVTDHQGGQ